MTMSAVDFLDQWFETDVLKATMSASGIIGTFLGVRSPGTAYVLLHHYMGEIDGAFRSWGLSRGGTGAISNAIAAAAREAGAEIRIEAPVAKIIVKDGGRGRRRARERRRLTARRRRSSVDPHLTFLKLVGAEHLPDEFVADVRRFKFRGSSGKVNLALDGLPDFTALPGAGPHLRGADLDLAERRLHGARLRRRQVRALLAAAVHGHRHPVPHRPDGGAARQARRCRASCSTRPTISRKAPWDDQREAFGDAVIDTIAEYAPEHQGLILHRQVLSPLDIDATSG